MRRILTILYFLPVAYLVALPGYLEVRGGNMLCSGIEVIIADSSEAKFVTKGEISGIVRRTTGNATGLKCRELPLASIEENVRSLSELGVVEAYVTVEGKVVVEVNQREPIMRVITLDNRDLFVDKDGYIFYRRGSYTPRIHIVGGSLTVPSGVKNGESVFGQEKTSRIEQAISLVTFLRKSDFWNAQIDQIYFTGNGELDLVPRVGNHTIHMGLPGDYEEKFKNLEAFYKEALPKVGWRKYNEIDLEFKGQIICRK